MVMLIFFFFFKKKDLAVAFIIGGAFQAVVTSLINDIIMVSLMRKHVDPGNLCLHVSHAASNRHFGRGQFRKFVLGHQRRRP